MGIEHAKNRDVYNLSGREQYSVLEVINLLSNILDTRPKLLYRGERQGDQKETKTVLTKAESELGYSPQISLEVGLRRQIPWQVANPIF